jgi:hypothetical protein
LFGGSNGTQAVRKCQGGEKEVRAVSQELEEILEIVKDLNKRPKWTQWLIPALISAVVSLLVAIVANSINIRGQNLEKTREMAKMRLEVLNNIQKDNIKKARLILDYSLKPISDSKSHSEFEKKYNDLLSSFIASQDISPEQSEEAISSKQKQVVQDAEVNQLVEKLDTPDRYAASRELISRYSEMPNEITTALINSIKKNEYRKNLYIAYTLAKIPDRWTGEQEQFKKICNLRNDNNYKKDKTFTKRVDQAIKNYKNQSIKCP